VPPERLLGNADANPFAADCYALGGLLLWEIMTSAVLFEEFTDWETFVRAICTVGVRPPVHHAGQERPGVSRTSPSELPVWAPMVAPRIAALMAECWVASPPRRPTASRIVERLDECMVEIGLCEDRARAFWRSIVSDKDETEAQQHIGWDDLVPALVRATGIPTKRVEVLRPEFVSPTASHGEVSLDAFDQAILTFGDFYASAATLGRMCSIVESLWWHSDASREDASKLLLGRQPGTFLVRRRRVERPNSLLSNGTVGARLVSEPLAISNASSRPALAQRGQHRLVRADPRAGTEEVAVKVSGKWAIFPSLEAMISDDAVGLSQPCRAEVDARRSAYDDDEED
jgi:SH2 domain